MNIQPDLALERTRRRRKEPDVALGATAIPSQVAVSFEFFPPKDPRQETSFWTAATCLRRWNPTFMSVTYGAGGSTRGATGDLVVTLQQRLGVAGAAHLTSIGARRDEVDAVADAYWATGIRHIVALRGDPPRGVAARYTPRRDGYPFADALVAGLKRRHDFEISVAAYPEVHPQAASAAADLDHLKRKIDAGASRAITQFCFDPAAMERFLDRASAAGISVPIVPGILPISNFTRLAAFAEACGARIPLDLHTQCEGIDTEPERRDRFAVAFAIAQCRALQKLGIRQFHFYTLNRADLVEGICAGIGADTEQARRMHI
ncbi:MAG: methylenetetrahydrofolate reductase [Rhodospirillaceae bacterium]|nr:methylenetetrahydrofolate reductase [Rhodospirillaceae bacterium]